MKSLLSFIELAALLFKRAFAAIDAFVLKKESERRQYERDHLEDAPDEFFADHFDGVPDSTAKPKDRKAKNSKADA